MAPRNVVRVICLPANSNVTANSTIDQICCPSTTSKPNTDSQEFQAVLYIVITLLFYSIGIIIGIVTYLKKEKEEIEENKMYEEFIALNRSQANLLQHRSDRVQLVIDHLKKIEEAKLERQLSSARHSADSTGERKASLRSKQTQIHADMGDVSAEEVKEGKDSDIKVDEGVEEDPFQNRRLSQVVAKILEGDSNIESVEDSQTDSIQKGGYFQDDYQYLVEYNEEPKNKELFRDAKQDGADAGPPLSFDESVSHSEETDRLMNVDSSKPQDLECEGRFIEEIDEGDDEHSSPEVSLYHWSVTSV